MAPIFELEVLQYWQLQNTMSESAKNKLDTLPIRAYLDETVIPLVLQALKKQNLRILLSMLPTICWHTIQKISLLSREIADCDGVDILYLQADLLFRVVGWFVLCFYGILLLGFRLILISSFARPVISSPGTPKKSPQNSTIFLSLYNIQQAIKNKKMNPESSSDIRQIERFIMDSNIYLLTMFDRKLASFSNSINWENKDTRKQSKENNLNPKAHIDSDNFYPDPIKTLSRDLTKPIWNCITRVDPRMIYRRESPMEPIDIIRTLSKILSEFSNRIKNEHEDEGSLRISIQPMEYDRQERELKELANNLYLFIQDYIIDLFGMLMMAVEREMDSLGFSSKMEEQDQQSMDERSSKNPCTRELLTAAKEMLSLYLSRSDENYNNELDIFTKFVITNLGDIVNCKIGSLVLCLMPKLMTLPLFIHPLLVGIYGFYRTQLEDIAKKDEHKHKCGSSNGMRERDRGDGRAFGEMGKSESLSKIVFLNLDGYESEFNVDIAKYLCKNLMYISFPRESNGDYENTQNPQIKEMEDKKSQRLLHKYYFGDLNEDEKRELLYHFKLPQKQLKKNLYMFPLHSRKLADLSQLPSIYNQETAFISFIMKELIFSQILEFSPSMIVVSYSGKIRIEDQFFVELMKELTALGNYKVVFYANLSKNYLFEEFYEEELRGLELKRKEQAYFHQFESNMKIISDLHSLNSPLRINCDLLEKMSMAMKISSGTFTLNPSSEVDSYSEKYKNFKAMCYTASLLQKLWPEMPNLAKLKMRFNEYSGINRVLQSYFTSKGDTFDKLFGKVISKFHINLMKEIEKLLFGAMLRKDKGDGDTIQGEVVGEAEVARRKAVEKEIDLLRASIHKKYGQGQIKQRYRNVKFQKFLQISTQKVESKYFAHIPRYQIAGKYRKKQAQNLICLQFFTVLQKQKLPVQLSPSTSKILYSQSRKHRNSYIYITNHIVKQTSTNFTHLCGVVSEEFDSKVSPKVLLYPVSFEGGPQLTPFQTYTEFNFFQTNNYVFMFWPKIYDCRMEILAKIANIKYSPNGTLLFFSANRKTPDRFTLIHNGQDSYILPRSGCQCYQLPQTNTIHIFGGFYSNEKDHLLFQTDITKLKYQPVEDCPYPRIQLENIPKQFYFDFQSMENNREIGVITRIKNQMVRPRLEYQFVEADGLKDEDGVKSVFLVGGVGEKFVRPYSMIGYMAHKLVFNTKTGDLVSTKRINMNNIIPINTHSPVKMRCPMQAKILSHAQNRSINFITGQCGANAYSISHNAITFNPESQRFEYESEYQFCDTELRNYREETSVLRKQIVETKLKANISAKCSKGKQYTTNFITLTSQNRLKYIVELFLLVSTDVLNTHEELPSAVRLTGSSILSIDISGGTIYALIRHPIYTLDQCILAYYDLYELGGRLKESKPIDVQLRELHKFDQNVGYGVLIAANTTTVLLLHGQRFEREAELDELVLKRNRKRHIKIDKVLPNEYASSLSTATSQFGGNRLALVNGDSIYNYSEISFVGGLSCSLFINQNNGAILCFSFKTIERAPEADLVFFCLQKLQLQTQRYAWQCQRSQKYSFRVDPSVYGVGSLSHIKNRRREALKLLEIKEWKDTDLEGGKKNMYELVGYIKDELVSAYFDAQGNTNVVVFKPCHKKINEYFKQMVTSSQKQSSVLLEKTLEAYNEFRSLNKSIKEGKLGFEQGMHME